MAEEVRVAVLGCGPAGLIAAHALQVLGVPFEIFSKRRKSEMYGAQYMHAPIPGATNRAPVQISYTLRGTIDGYRHKVYGLREDVDVSPETLEECHDAWDIRDTYEALWDMYFDKIVDSTINPTYINALLEDDYFSDIVSTIPRKALCARNHLFEHEEIWAAGEAPERGVFLDGSLRVPRNTVVCNGNPDDLWYRVANVFGRCTAEWPLDTPAVAMPEGVVRVGKPLSHGCTCWPSVKHVGRYGQWSKGILVSDVWVQVNDLFGPNTVGV